MDTKLSIDQIHLALRNSGMWNKRADIMIPNLYWGMLDYEADFVVISKSGYMTEVEIKRSLADFKADFNKSHTHNAEQVYYFYYCVPEKIYDKAIEFLRHHYTENTNADYPAVLYYTEDGQIINPGFGSRYQRGRHRKLFLEEILQVARLGQLRYWNLLEKIINKQNNE